MATVSVLVGNDTSAAIDQRAPRMVLRDEAGLKINIMRAPRVTRVSNIGITWAPSPRPGKEAVQRLDGLNSPEMDMEFYLGYPDLQRSVMNHLNILIRAAGTRSRILMTYSSHESTFYRIVRFDYEIEHRNKNNEPSRVRVNVTFRRSLTNTVGTGPVSGGVNVAQVPRPTPTVASAPASTGGGSRGTYTVKKGDTLWAISIRYYGSGTQWRRIADANGVSDPRKLQIGKVLTIP